MGESVKLRWYQDEAGTALMEALKNPECHPIVVAPTGSGKSLMICDLVDRFMTKHPLQKILVLSHIKEILEQDFDALTDYFEGYHVGLYSAGLHSRIVNKVTVAGIQSVYRKSERFADFGLIIIDECHLVTIKATGMYRQFLSHIKANYVGFTATHFRLGHGYIHRGKDALFNHIAYNISSPANFNRLVDEGFLTQLIPKGTKMKMNTQGLKIRAGDFIEGDLSLRFDRKKITERAVKEIIEFGENYKRWLVFAIDIAHAEHITEELKLQRINACVVHSKMTDDRDDEVKKFRDGHYRAVVNVNILTTGFDVPGIDLIAMLRPTQSPVIHVQTIGRGLRVAKDKEHCLVLDFAGNTMRLGPINDVTIKSITERDGEKRGAPMKECPECNALCHIKVKICEFCGHEFVFKTKLRSTAGTRELVKKVTPQWHRVDDVTYSRHHKEGGVPSMRVRYRIGIKSFSEWVCYEHHGYAKYKADHWVKYRSPVGMPMPKDLNQLIEYAPWLRKPTHVLANLGERLPKIHKARFEVPAD